MPTSTDVGKYLRVTVTYSDAFGFGQSLEIVSSNPVATNPLPPPPTVQPPPPPPPPSRNTGGGGGGGGGGSRNRSPEFRDGSKAERIVAENAPSGTFLGDPIEARDSDDDDVLVYSLGGEDADLFEIDPTDGQLTTVDTFDFESRSVYMVIVSVTDGKSSTDRPNDNEDDFIEVTIEVRNEEEPGEVTLSTEEPFINLTVTARLEDQDGNLRDISWTWEQSADGETWAPVDNVDAPSFEPGMDNIGLFLRVTATYSDVHGASKAVALTTEAVIANTVPGFGTEGPIQLEAREHTDSGAGGPVGEPILATDRDGDRLTYSLGGDDADIFLINSATGQISVLDDISLDYETRDTYSLTVSVRDSRDEMGDADEADDRSVAVTVTLKNIDERGALTPSLTNPRVAAPFTVALADLDGNISEIEWTWERSPSIDEQGRGAWVPINSANSETYTPTQNDAGQYLRISARYSDGQGPYKNAQIIVVGEILTYTGPIFINNAVTLEVAENTRGGAAVQTPVVAESGAADVTYSLSGSDAQLFTVDEETGQIRVAEGALLDYEQGSGPYTVTLTAADTSGQTASVTIAITVTDVSLPGIADRYDSDKNEQITRDEALSAIADYFVGAITKQDVESVLAHA